MSRGARKRSAGFALVAAIFLLVVLAALGAFIVSVSTSQQIGSALDVQGERAYQAARSGIEWGVYQQTRNGSCASTTSFAFPAAATTLATFTVTVKCSAYPDASGGPTVYQIIATACNQPAAGSCPNSSPGLAYVERQMQVSF
ncbi:hypothetical protein GALL_107690 [mine drainage metagenome]|uniref:Agglutinin biogenesis protein MshP n=1 Tax=mine drainage metagenome TaxID=410659 RepID=A0A1J5T005_9ZZZZ